MIQKEKLVQFYFNQYRDSALKLKKKNSDGKKTYEQRIGRLAGEMKHMKPGRLTQPHLEEYHRQIRNMAYYAFKQKNQFAIMQIRDFLMEELVRLDMETMRPEEQELVTGRFLEYLRTERPGEICQQTMKKSGTFVCGIRHPQSDNRPGSDASGDGISEGAGNEASFYPAYRSDQLR